MKGKDIHPRLFYPEKLSFRMEGQIKCFPDKVKLKEFIDVDSDQQCPWCCRFDEEIHTDCRSPVEKRDGMATL